MPLQRRIVGSVSSTSPLTGPEVVVTGAWHREAGRSRRRAATRRSSSMLASCRHAALAEEASLRLQDCASRPRAASGKCNEQKMLVISALVAPSDRPTRACRASVLQSLASSAQAAAGSQLAPLAGRDCPSSRSPPLTSLAGAREPNHLPLCCPSPKRACAAAPGRALIAPPPSSSPLFLCAYIGQLREPGGPAAVSFLRHVLVRSGVAAHVPRRDVPRRLHAC